MNQSTTAYVIILRSACRNALFFGILFTVLSNDMILTHKKQVCGYMTLYLYFTFPVEITEEQWRTVVGQRPQH